MHGFLCVLFDCCYVSVSRTVFLVLFDRLLRQCLWHCFLLAVFDFATLMSRALFSLSSVRLFVTLVSRALFSFSSVWLFITSVSRAHFSLSFVTLFDTSASRALFSLKFCLNAV